MAVPSEPVLDAPGAAPEPEATLPTSATSAPASSGAPPPVARSRRARAARWLAPSAVAACIGALVAGGYEAAGEGALRAIAATIGFLAIIVTPSLFVLGVAARGLIAAWRPAQLAARLTEDGGGMPRLAGWLGTLWLAALVIAWVAFQGTWQLATWTAFKPLTVSFLQPIFAVAAAILVVVASRPAVDVLSAIARAFDRWWRRKGRRTLLTPRILFTKVVVASLALGYVVWRLLVRPRLGPFDTSVGVAPVAAVVTTIGVTLAWPRLGRVRPLLGWGLAAATLAAIACALVTARTQPSLTLEIWGDRPLAGVAIERLFDLDEIRSRISLAEFRPVDRPGSPHPDIVLVTIDTVRADHTPPYGGSAEMPTLKQLGERGAVFNWAFSPSNVTRRSIPSMIIGAAATRIPGRVIGWALRVDPRHVMVAERMRAGGYETAGFMCCRGFYDPEVRTGLQRGLEHLEIETNGRTLAAAAHTWLAAREQRPGNRPLFLWMHVLEPHNWEMGMAAPRSDAEKTRLYDHSLEISDQILTELLAGFSDRAPEHAPIVIVTADHGEALGDHGQPNHSTDLYNSQIRVPLVVAGPGIRPGHLQEAVSLTDLVPTLLELAGFQAPTGPSIDGRSIADLMTGKRLAEPDRGRAFAAMIKDRSNPGGVTAIVDGRWKLIENGGAFELYDFYADPNEQTNLIGIRTEIAKKMHELLDAMNARSLEPAFE